MSHPLTSIINIIIGCYNRIPLQNLFLDSIQLEITQTPRNIFPQINYISKEDIISLKGKYLITLKLHSHHPILLTHQILESSGIIIAKDGSISINSFNYRIHEYSQIQSLTISCDHPLKNQELDIYCSLLEPFYSHLSLKLIKYSTNVFEPFTNMFEKMQQLPQNTFFKIFESSPQRVSLKDLNISKGRYFDYEKFQCWFFRKQQEDEISQIDTLHNLVPLLDFNLSLNKFGSIIKNFKYISNWWCLGRHSLQNKSRKQSHGSFHCIINFRQIVSKKFQMQKLQSDLQDFLKQMIRQLHLMGIGNWKNHLLHNNYEDVKLLSKLLEIDEMWLVQQLIL